MTFVDAIKSGFTNYLNFEGRASRSEFWWWVLFVFLATLVTTLVHHLLGNLFSLAVLLPGLAVTARRLHDIDRSGWWQLVGIIPVIGWLVMVYWCLQPAREPNRFGTA